MDNGLRHTMRRFQPLSSLRRRLRTLGISLLLAITLLVGANGPLAQGLGIGGPPRVLAAAAKPQGTPHHVDPTSGTQSVLHQPPAANLPPFTPHLARPTTSHGFVPSMKTALFKLDPAKDTQFTGSDGRLEIDVPAGAITATDTSAAAGGTLSLRVTEVAPPSGSNAGSSAVSLGSYTVEVVDGQGNRLGQFAHGLRKGLTLKLHYGVRDSALDLDRAFVVFNGSHPQALTNLGPYSTQATTHDRKSHLLQAQLPADPALTASAAPPTTAASTPTPATTTTPPPTNAPTHSPTTAPSGPSGTSGHSGYAAAPFSLQVPSVLASQQTPIAGFTFDTYPPVAKFGSPDPLNVDLNSGGLTEGIQLDVPPGPAGAMPNITLAYNSAAVSEQHSPQGAAGWVGEGWSMSLGSISWAEHNVFPTCSGSACTNTWQSTWQLTDPFGTSTELIPPNLATSTYYDDSTNWWCTTGNASSVACPIQFQTARETYAKVYAYVGPNQLGAAPDPPPCFRVYLTNGVMEEFGCTPDSLQYYPLQAGALLSQNLHDVYYPVNWMLDLITNPQGDQVHITYQSDTETAPDGLTYPRDLVMSTIEWDSPDCVSATQACGSGTWHPHYRVSFGANHHLPTRTTTTGTCNPDGLARCDDPTSISGGVASPLVNGTMVLNDAYVQTNPSPNGSTYNSTTWNTVRDYQFSYEQSGPTTITDPATGMQLSAAGYLDLTGVQEVGDGSGLGAPSYPPTTMSYTSQTEYYEDGSYTPYNPSAAGACGPTWNTGGNGGVCDLWSQTYDGNSRYLSSISNGQGLAQTINWANARSNTHGVNSGVGSDIANPLYCNTHQTGYPCNSADDQAWSRIVVTGRSDTVVQLTQAGQGGQQTSTPSPAPTPIPTSSPTPCRRRSVATAWQECTGATRTTATTWTTTTATSWALRRRPSPTPTDRSSCTSTTPRKAGASTTRTRAWYPAVPPPCRQSISPARGRRGGRWTAPMG